MSILVNCLSAVVGGGVTYLRNLMPLLPEALARLTDQDLHWLLGPSQAALAQHVDSESVIRVEHHLSGYRRFLWERRHLRDIVRDYDVGTVFTPTQIAAHQAGAVNVVMLRNMEPFLHWRYPYSPRSRVRNMLLAAQSGSTLRSADRVIAVSEFSRNYARAELAVAPDRIDLVYHGRDRSFDATPDEARALPPGIDPSRPYLFTCGSILPYRRTETVIDAFERLDDPGRDLQLVIAGTGTDKKYGEKIDSQVQRSQRRDDIILAGYVDKDVMHTLYAGAAVFIMASEIEACPNIAIEAMASGAAIAAADAAPLPEMFAGAALMFARGDADAAAGAVQRLLDDQRTNAALRSAARKRAAFFDWQQTARATAEILTAS